MHDLLLKDRPWKSGVTAPLDANRPKCWAMISLDGTTGQLVEDETDQIDWLVVIKYQPKTDHEH